MRPDDVYKLNELGRAGARLFAVACAYRVGAVVEHFGSVESKRAYDAILCGLWSLAARPSDCPAELADLQQKLASCPEAEVNDMGDRRYFAMRALASVADALASFQEESLPAVVSNATAASYAVLDLMVELAASTKPGDVPLSIDTYAERATHLRFVKTIAELGDRDFDFLRRRSVTVPWSAAFFGKVDAARGWGKREATTRA